MEQIPHIPATTLPQHMAEEILHKLQSLPIRYVPEVEHFIDYLRHRHNEGEKNLTEGFFALSAETWDDE